MARRRRDLGSSLFPFLSVLACVIGTLALLIAALAIGQVARDLRARTDPAVVEPTLAAERASLRAVEAKLADLSTVEAELAAANAELRKLGVRADQSEAQERRAVDARLAAAASARRLASLKRKERELDESLAGVRTALRTVHTGGDDRPIRITPRGHATPLRPFFVECRASGLRLYHESSSGSLFLERDSAADRASFQVFLQRVRAVRNHTVIFLIRPDGVDTYQWALDQMRDVYVRHAKLPLPGQGEIEFEL